jgi:hypothetical protein
MIRFRCPKRVTLIAGTLIGLLLAVPAAAQLFPGVTIVNDPLNKVVLLQQLTQLEQQLQIAQANIKNVGTGGWGNSVQNVSQVNGMLTSASRTISNTGSQSLPVTTAQTQLQQVPGEEANLQAAQALSDGAAGQVQVTAAGNRLESLAVGQMQEQRELQLSNVIQTQQDYQQTTTALWGPSMLSGRL